MGSKLNKNISVFVVLLILIAIAVFQNVSARDKEASKTQNQNSTEGTTQGYLAPSFQLEGLDGNAYNIGGKREKPMMLNFWASWCDPCALEAPDLKNIYEKYKNEFDLYAINTTDKDDIAHAKKFVKQYQLPFPILLDQAGKVSDQFRISLIPTSFLVDRNGVVVEVIHGLSPNELERKIKKLINEG
jgi:thiol-disulfide isomerase/thioredoxin